MTIKNNEGVVESSSIYVDTDLLNEQDKKAGQKFKIERNLTDMDEDEIAYPDLYKMRKRCEFMLDVVEKLYAPEQKYILSRFVRFTANKRDFNPKIRNTGRNSNEKY